MSETDEKCAGSVYPEGLRIAGGFPCSYPARYTVRDQHGKEERVCGVHRNQFLRRNGTVEVSR